MAKAFKYLPGPKGIPVFGSVFDYSKLVGKFSFERMHDSKRVNNKIYGPIYKEKMGPLTIVQIFDPGDAETIFRADGKLPIRPPLPITIAAHKKDGVPLGLGSLNGDSWYELRKSVQRLMMHPRAASFYLPGQSLVADDLLQRVMELLDDDGALEDFLSLITRYTMESIAVVCFNKRIGCLDEGHVESTANPMMEASSDMFQAVQKSTFAFPWYRFFRTPIYKQFLRGKKNCDSIAFQYIKEAKGLIENNINEIDSRATTNLLHTLISHGKLKPEEIVGITTDLFNAGIDSTANALSFLIYNLAKNSEKQEVLASEINRILPIGSQVTWQAIEKMTYLKACVKESFRLNFPVEGGTTRVLQKPLVLSGYHVPENTLVAINSQTMCLSKKYFHEPQKYKPERWLGTDGAPCRPCPPFVMLPFGFGSRMCIGRRFAEQEIYLAVIKIIQRYKLGYDGKEVGMLNRVFTVPDKPIRIIFTARQMNT